MSQLFRIYRMCLALLFIFAVKMGLGAQTPEFPDVSTLTPETLFTQTIDPLYGLLVLLSGYLSAFIPGVNRLKPFYRVAAFALATGLGFFLFGAGTWKLALTYFLTSGLYVVVFKNIFPSPAAKTAARPGAAEVTA